MAYSIQEPDPRFRPNEISNVHLLAQDEYPAEFAVGAMQLNAALTGKSAHGA